MLKKIMIIIISINLLSAEVVTTLKGSKYTLQISKTDKYKMKGKIDLGLGDNLLEGLQKKIYKKIDETINPVIEKLEEIKKENIKKFNSENYVNKDTNKKALFKLMEIVSYSDFMNSLKKLKEKYNSDVDDSLFDNHKYQVKFSKFNPFRNVSKKLIEDIKKAEDNVKNWNKLYEYVKKRTEKYSKFIDKYGTIDMNKVMANMVKGNDAEQKFLKDIMSGKAPFYAIQDYYKTKYPNYFPSKNKVVFEFNNKVPIENNMCTIIKCIFNDSSCDLKDKKKKKEFEKKIEELKKLLMQRAIYILIKNIIKEFYIQEYLQFAQRSMKCSMQATIATTLDLFGIDVKGVPLSEVKKVKVKNAKSENSAAQNIKDSMEKTANCLKTDNMHTKKQTNVEGKVGVNAKGQQLVMPTLLTPFSMAEWTPFAAPGGAVKVSTDAPTKEAASIEKAKSCILKGRTQTWRTAFNECMKSEEDMQLKFNTKLQIIIQNLFEKLRKHKKIACELEKSLSKSDKLNISLLKYNLLPKFIKTEYNSDDEDKELYYFFKALLYVVNKDIDIPKNLTTDNQVCINNILDSIKNNNKNYQCSLNYNITLNSSQELENVNDNIKQFCNETGKEIYNKYIKYKKKQIKPELLSDLEFCSNYFSDNYLKPFTVFKDIDTDTMLKDVLLDIKYNVEDNKKSFEKYIHNPKEIYNYYKNTFEYLNMLSYKEKENICNNIDNQEQDNKYIKDAITKYCEFFKFEESNRLLQKMKNDFKEPVLNTNSIKKTITEIEKELENLSE